MLRKGFSGDEPLLEEVWEVGPKAEKDEPYHLDGTYLTVQHLENAKKILEGE